MTDDPQTIRERFLQHVQEQRLCRAGDRILLAVSGGLDSMVMADLFQAAPVSLGIAHAHFGLRGEESDRDEAFVRDYAAQQGLPFYSQRFSTRVIAREHHLSIEEAARDLRYAWFAELRSREGYDAVAVAHHRDDHIETVLLNFFRGTGIRGMHGIRPRRGHIIRPLLVFSREELQGYARGRGLSHIEDSSNRSEAYLRNYLRLQVMPLLAKGFPGVRQQMADSIGRLAEAEQLYDQALERHRSLLLEQRGEEVFIPVGKLKKARPLSTIAYELFRPFGFSPSQAAGVLALLDSDPGRTMYSATHRVLKDRKWLIISPLRPGAVLTELPIAAGESHIALPGLQLRLEERPAQSYALATGPRVASLDAAKVRFPLILRRWKTGDYFYPLGMRKKKKLSRFFIDEKLSLQEKADIWVLTSADRICWVVGMRIDDRFKVTPSTRTVLRITAKAGREA